MWGSKGQWLGSTLQRLQGILHMRGLPGSFVAVHLQCEWPEYCLSICSCLQASLHTSTGRLCGVFVFSA